MSGRKEEVGGGVLNTKESHSAGVNTGANWDVRGEERHLVKTPFPSLPAL